MTTTAFDHGAGLDQGPGAAVVADDAGAAAAGAEAIAQVGARLALATGWGEAAARIADLVAPPALLMIETAGVSADEVERLLPDLAATIDTAKIVVAFPAAHLD